MIGLSVKFVWREHWNSCIFNNQTFRDPGPEDTDCLGCHAGLVLVEGACVEMPSLEPELVICGSHQYYKPMDNVSTAISSGDY